MVKKDKGKSKVKPKGKAPAVKKTKKGRPKGSKRTKADIYECELRTDFAEELLLKGELRHVVRKKIEKKYGVKCDQASNYIKKVYARWAARKRPNLNARLTEGRRRRKLCYARALKSGDLAAAHKHLSELEKMDGIAGVETFEGKLTVEGGEKPVTVEVDATESLQTILAGVMVKSKTRKTVANKVAPPRKEGKPRKGAKRAAPTGRSPGGDQVKGKGKGKD